MQEITRSKLENYVQIREEALALYNTFGSIQSPALGEVTFAAAGFNHLVYEKPKKERDKRAQILKFELLSKAKAVLELSTTFQEYEEGLEEVRRKINKKWITKTVKIRSWGFVAIIKGYRIKVVVVENGNGKKEFLSVIPAWITRWYRDIKLIETSIGLRSENLSEVLKNATIEGDVL